MSLVVKISRWSVRMSRRHRPVVSINILLVCQNVTLLKLNTMYRLDNSMSRLQASSFLCIQSTKFKRQ